MNRRQVIVVIAFALLTSGSARATEPGKSAPIQLNEATSLTKPGMGVAKVAAAELARLILPKEEWSRAVDLLSRDVQARLQGHPGSQLKFPADFGAKVRGEVEKALPYDELIAMHAKGLGGAYNEAELNELLAFYRTPLGQKSLKTMPEVAGNVAQQSQTRFEQKMPEIMQLLSSGLKHPAPPKGKTATKSSKQG